MSKFKYVPDLWDDEKANSLDDLGRLVYRSNLLGTDWRITNTGGGNTSSKLTETDPISGEQVEVLWVKGSGGDLRTATRVNFASLYQDKLIQLQDVYEGFDERGLKTPAEDAMVGMYRHCTFNLNSRAPSIDTPLHSFIPHKIVDHTHPVACIAIATAEDGPELTRKIYGDDVIWVDWRRPGFELGLELQRVCRDHPGARGVMLGAHGLINWADTDRDCYYLSLELIERAAEYLAEHDLGDDTFGGQKYESLPDDRRREVLVELLPWLRGRVGQQKRSIGTVDFSDDVQRFVNSADAPRLAELGTSCPDHFLRTKIKPLYVDWQPGTEAVSDLKAKLLEGLTQYQADYSDYYEAHKHSDSPAMRVSSPTVILIPGVGMVTWGKTKSESRVVAEFYKAAIGVMRGAESVSSYTALPRQEAFDIEYWLLEEAKLQRMPAEKELSRRIVAVFGAGSGIGRSLTTRLLNEGATVVALDLVADAARETAEAELGRVGMGIGVAGTGSSGGGVILGLGCDVTERSSIRQALDEALFAYGGVDAVVVTAGYYTPTPSLSARDAGPNGVDDSAWTTSFAVNAVGPYLVADEVARIWDAQQLSGSLVMTTSVNGVVPKQGSFAYDTSKAAANHLVRELAIRFAPNVRVNAVAPATVIEGSSMFPRDRVIDSLKKYGIEFGEDDSTETLRDRLAGFYADRTLTKRPIRLADQTEALFLLTSDRFSRTTGQVINVDGGLTEAFQR